ncbi:MAG: flagellar hook-length control protein FliK, partial [Nitrospirae bacterium]|nr:flagellar hook-length control protein FliK [Nitrospirota bacterium]
TLKEALNTIIFRAEESLQHLSSPSLRDTSSGDGLKDLLGKVQQTIDDTLATLRDFKVSDALNIVHDSKIKDTLQVLQQKIGQSQDMINSLKDGHQKVSINPADDQKALLLRLKDFLQHDKTFDMMKYSGTRQEDVLNTVDKFIKNIEHFQVNSRVNDMVYTFLPFAWKELKDGEFLFKKNKYNAKKSYTCDINLDLDKMGKLSISTTVSEGTFFISFNAEKSETRDAIVQNRNELEKRFAGVGLKLSVINIGLKQNIDFKETKVEKGLNLKV